MNVPFFTSPAGLFVVPPRKLDRRSKSNSEDGVVELGELLVLGSKDRDVQRLGGLANLLDA